MLETANDAQATPIAARDDGVPLQASRQAFASSRWLVHVKHARDDNDPPITKTSHWLVLALVIERSSHAYEIGHRYDRRFGTFAPTAQNAVYGALDRLSTYDLVISTESPVPAGRGTRTARIVYSATPEGREAHRRWLLSAVKPRRWRMELLARIATGAELDNPDLLKLVGIYEQMAREHEQSVHDPALSGRDVRSRLLGHLVAREQRAVLEAQLHWVKETAHELQSAPA